MKETTLLFLLRDGEILLAMKKRGFGVGRWNGVGGKIEVGETVEQAATRECLEEIGVTPKMIEKAAELTFLFSSGATGTVTHTFITRQWDGEPVETEEMAPQWFAHDNIPFDSMWPDDQHWLPHILEGKKVVASFSFDDQYRMLADATRLTIADKL